MYSLLFPVLASVSGVMKLGTEGMYLNITKGVYDKTITNITLNGKN
jgi:hypothetical protein